MKPGLAGRFGSTIHFEDYTNAELMKILVRFCETQGSYSLSSEAEQRCRRLIPGARRLLGSKFDNARMVRRLFEARIRLRMFDPPQTDPYRRLTKKDIDSQRIR